MRLKLKIRFKTADREQCKVICQPCVCSDTYTRHSHAVAVHVCFTRREQPAYVFLLWSWTKVGYSGNDRTYIDQEFS
jgi:hypothetical protein